MRLRKPGSRAEKASQTSARERAAKRAEREPSAAKPGGSVAKRTAVELAGIGRELVRIPVALYMRIAERLGAWVLAAWLRIWPYLVRLWKLAGRALAWAERVVTPARVTVGVALLTAVALAGSQWADLSAVSVGTDAYIGLEDIAPAPEVTTKTVGDAHAWVVVPLAVLAAALHHRQRPGTARARPPPGPRRHRGHCDQPAHRPARGARRGRQRGCVYERLGRSFDGLLGTTRVRHRPHPPRGRVDPRPQA